MNEDLVSDFMKLGCKTRKEAAIGLQVYLELCEVKRYWDVEYFYDDGLQSMYVTGKKSKSHDASVFVPMAVSDDVSFARMQSYFDLCKSDVKTVYLAMVDSDSTCVCYRITDGIGSPSKEKPRVDDDEKREQLDGQLRKCRKLLEQAAMYGTPITMSNKPVDNVTDECST